MYADLVVITAFVFLYSMLAGRLERTVIFGPMVFVGPGLVVGLGLAWMGACIFNWSWKRGWTQLPVVALAIGCFAVAQSLHGSGYVAAFAGGLLFGFMAQGYEHKLLVAAEGTGEIFALVTRVIFGSAVIGQTYEYFNWQVVLYAILSLTVIRMLPIFVSLTGSGQSTSSNGFLAG